MKQPDLIALATRFLASSEENKGHLPGIHVLQRTSISTFEAVVYTPVICLILRGAKETMIGDQRADLRAGDALLVSHDLPVTSVITQASAEAPYLALIVSIDIGMIRTLYEQVGGAITEGAQAHALAVGPADPAWVEPLGRYLSLLSTPLDAQVLGPQIRREIHYRLLMSPIGAMLRNLLTMDSHASRVATAILKIRAEFRGSLCVADMARAAGMSVSSFHEHFRSVTGTTPLQYLKDLRLIEARSLLQSGAHSVSAAGVAVGYESPTHFSRDYTRKYGISPRKDAIAVLSA